MSDRPMNQISLRLFRETITDITHPIEVSKRGGDGVIRILGRWVPYEQEIRRTEAKVVDRLDLSDGDEVVRVPAIKTAAEAAAVVRTDPVRAVPKPSQRRK